MFSCADAIVGNPPYHGSQRIRRELGDAYAEWLRAAFGIGLKDYAVYWFRKAHERLDPGGRAGLVATNSVSQGRSRKVSLDWIVDSGGVIFDAVSSEDWSGEAAVDVSIVNWIKEPSDDPDRFVLDGQEVDGISPSLRPIGDDTASASSLKPNRGLAFQGPIPGGDGFVLDQDEALELLASGDADYRQVVRPYLVGDDVANNPTQRPTRWIVDLGVRPLADLSRRIIERRQAICAEREIGLTRLYTRSRTARTPTCASSTRSRTAPSPRRTAGRPRSRATAPRRTAGCSS